MSEHKFIAGVIFFTFLLAIMFGLYASSQTSINCPEIEVTNQSGLGWILTSIGLFFSPCSGLPWWVYIVIFTPLAIALLGWLTPFVGG
jgi:hypothetical protein